MSSSGGAFPVAKRQASPPPPQGLVSSRDNGPPSFSKLTRVHRAAWRLFKPHHYLSGELHKSARCFVAFVAEREEPSTTSPAVCSDSSFDLPRGRCASSGLACLRPAAGGLHGGDSCSGSPGWVLAANTARFVCLIFRGSASQCLERIRSRAVCRHPGSATARGRRIRR